MSRDSSLSRSRALGTRIRQLRLNRGIAYYSAMHRQMQSAVGENAAIAPRRMSAIERSGNLTALELLDIAKTLKIPLDQFYEPPRPWQDRLT